MVVVRMKVKNESKIPRYEDLILETEESKFSEQFVKQLTLIFFDDE